MIDEINEFFELIVGEDGFISTLRCDNIFDERMYSNIKSKLSNFVLEWKKQELVPKKAMMAIVELTEYLARGSNFLSENEAIRLENASLEIKDIINELYATL